MKDYPVPVEDFLRYIQVVRGRSAGTAEQYGIDLTLFFKYLVSKRNGLPTDEESFAERDISCVDDAFAESVTRNEVLSFLQFIGEGRNNNARTRARKLSSVRAFYKYNTGVLMKYENNPTENIESPKIPKSLPKHLTKSESVELLKTAYTDEKRYTKRNFCILTLFLNCGLRLSELCGIDLGDFDREYKTLRVTGKGSKERMIYLNDACRSAIDDYLKVRDKTPAVGHKDAFFLSSRHKRISKQMVQTLVYGYLDETGLSNRGLSVHKLRHTAATLMYQTGKVDIRVLKDILGHEQLNTTQIYTHLSDESMKKAFDENPLAEINVKKETEGTEDGK